jgi:sugar lactone lactonase YvrE
VLAGSGARGYDDGTGTLATFKAPHSISRSVDGETLFVADTGNNVIRAVALVNGACPPVASETLLTRHCVHL